MPLCATSVMCCGPWRHRVGRSRASAPSCRCRMSTGRHERVLLGICPSRRIPRPTRRRACLDPCMTVCCSRCGRTLAADEAIWRISGPRGLGRVSVGRESSMRRSSCTPDRHKSEREVNPCLQCQRRVGILPGRLALCSARCNWSWHNAQRKARRAARRLAGPACLGCEKPFERTRRHQATCSPACRQRVHRRRRSATRTISNGPEGDRS
jgi:hypothetical protein